MIYCSFLKAIFCCSSHTNLVILLLYQLRVRSGASGSSSGAKAKHIQAQRKSLSPSSSTSPAIQPTPAIAPSVTSEYATSITSTEGVQGDAISEHEGYIPFLFFMKTFV